MAENGVDEKRCGQFDGINLSTIFKKHSPDGDDFDPNKRPKKLSS
jgi:hypothetical protein